MVDDRIKNIKVAVHDDDDQFRQAQEKLFELGAYWCVNCKKEFLPYNARYLFVCKNGGIIHSRYNKRLFDEDPKREIYFEDLMEMEAQEKEDFSKFIGKDKAEGLCIFGEKMLQSIVLNNRTISIKYDNYYREDYDETPDYEVVNIQDLKEGDIFCNMDVTPDTATKTDFKYFNMISGAFPICNFLRGSVKKEFLDCEVVFMSEKVKRFLRD